jgi:hypothetical protein
MQPSHDVTGAFDMGQNRRFPKKGQFGGISSSIRSGVIEVS